jgi:hypothetical protein
LSFQLPDYSSLREAEPSGVVIPLNGVRYHAIPEVAADQLMSASQGAVSALPENLGDVAAGTSLETLVETNPGLAAAMAKAGSSTLTRAREFILSVLEPDSATKWLANIQPPPKGLTPAKRREYQKTMITMRQQMAVFKDLVAFYSGRPTAPSSSSSNGDGGTGGTSTETVPVEG